MRLLVRATALAVIFSSASVAWAQTENMGFFLTSQNPGSGADLGGLEGADAHCTALAEAAGHTGRSWAAYLSTSSEDARDRIGTGPWHNAAGELIAEDVESLHSDANAISKETALDENGDQVNGRGDTPNRHDILTGSTREGTAAAETCEDWTSSGDGSAIVGHHDRMGLDDSEAARSWNASHPSRGCSLEGLRGTGGEGLLYCFATD